MSSPYRGFTLIETLMAVLIFSIAIAGLLSLARLSIHSGSVTKEDVTATYLAQDGLEFLVSIRDADMVGGTDLFFEHFLNGNPCVSTDCVIDTTISGVMADVVAECSGACPPLKYNTSTDKYSHISGTDSIYTRILRMTHIALPGGETELKATVTVSWRNSSGVTNSFSLSRNFMPIGSVSVGS